MPDENLAPGADAQQKTPFLVKAIIAFGRWTPFAGNRLRSFLLKLIEACHKGPVYVTFHGAPLKLYLDYIADRKSVFGRYNLKEMNFIIGGLKGASVFIDVGANTGLYTQVIAAHMAPASIVISVEPHPDMCARLRENLALLSAKGFARGVSMHVAPCAVGAASGRAFLNLDAGYGGAHIDAPGTNGIDVPLRPLLDILAEQGIDHIDALKIDIEGYEDRALMPFFASAPRALFPRRIVIEHSHSAQWEQDIIAHLYEEGYVKAFETGANLLLRLNT